VQNIADKSRDWQPGVENWVLAEINLGVADGDPLVKRKTQLLVCFGVTASGSSLG
jgi:hypothetical protein